MSRVTRRTLAALAAAGVVLAAAACGGSDDDDDKPANLSGGSLTLGIGSESFASQISTQIAIDEGYFTEEGIDGVDVITTDDHIKRLVDGEIDITQGDTGALLAQAGRGPGLEEDVLLLAGHRAKDGEPVESIATIADFLDGNVGLVNGYLAAQLKAREFLYDAANKEAVLEIARANGLEVPPSVESAWDREHAEISADAGFNVDGIEELVRSEQAAGRLPGNLRWREHFNLEPLYWTQEEAGLAHDPPPSDLPPRHEERVEVG